MSKQKKNILVLDGLRAIACLGVILYHFNYSSRNAGFWRPLYGSDFVIGSIAYFGESGVELFFLLSGFLLFLPFAKAMLFDSAWPSLPRFYIRRIFRIVPAYYVALCVFVLLLSPDYLHADHRSRLLMFFTFQMDFPGVFKAINGPFWTLAVEFQFYMLLPIVAWLIGLITYRGKAHWRLAKLSLCLAGMCAWGLLTRFWGDGAGRHWLPESSLLLNLKPYIYGSTGKYFEVFAIGMFICVLYVYARNNVNAGRWQERFRNLAPWLFTLGIVFLLAMSFLHFYHINADYYRGWALTGQRLRVFQQYWGLLSPIGYGVTYGLCMFALLHAPGWLQRPFEWRPLRWIGLLSFSLYMWHLPLMRIYLEFYSRKLIQAGFKPFVLYAGFAIFTVIFVTPMVVIMYRNVEMPGIKLGEWVLRQFERAPRPRPVESALVDSPQEVAATTAHIAEPATPSKP